MKSFTADAYYEKTLSVGAYTNLKSSILETYKIGLIK